MMSSYPMSTGRIFFDGLFLLSVMIRLGHSFILSPSYQHQHQHYQYQYQYHPTSFTPPSNLYIYRPQLYSISQTNNKNDENEQNNNEQAGPVSTDAPSTHLKVNERLVQKGFQFDSYHKRFDGGVWHRLPEKSHGVIEFLRAHRHDNDNDNDNHFEDHIQYQATRPYTQEFIREGVTSDGIVFRIRIDGGRRETTYRLAPTTTTPTTTTTTEKEWVETVPADSVLFMSRPTAPQSKAKPSQIRRRAYWDNRNHVHITESRSYDDDDDDDDEGTSPLEITKRSLEGSNYNFLKVERIYTNKAGQTYHATEYFERRYDNDNDNNSHDNDTNHIQDDIKPPGTTNDIKISPIQRVPGCVSNVDIFTMILPDGTVRIDGQSDSLLTRGILALVAEYIAGSTPTPTPTPTTTKQKPFSYQHILQHIDPDTVSDLFKLRHILTKGRNDGLANMIRVVQQQIRELVAVNYNQDDTEHTTTTKANEAAAPTVAMLLSGGVDSSVALNILTRQGYNVTAFYLKIWLEEELAHLGSCPWEDDFRVCEQVCEQAGVPLEAISLQQQYKERVISYTVQEAQKGRTPNPDIMCNSRVKFGCFYDAINERGFDYVASGHYARLLRDEKTGTQRLLRAPDPIKDQSYFLCALSQQQLSRVLFPIGHMQKSKVRDLAHEFDLPNRDRPDSQGLCFLGKVKFDEFLRAYLGERPGDILDAATGDKIGTHRGVWYHTVGQRKGIGKVLDPKATSRGPWYVVAKDPERDIVYASNQYEEDIFEEARRDIVVEDIHWISGKPPPTMVFNDNTNAAGARFELKIRHGPRIVEGTLSLSDATTGNVRLDKKDGGLAPGQYVVFYHHKGDGSDSDDDADAGMECLGGGVISEKHWAKFLLDREKDSSDKLMMMAETMEQITNKQHEQRAKNTNQTMSSTITATGI